MVAFFETRLLTLLVLFAAAILIGIYRESPVTFGGPGTERSRYVTMSNHYLLPPLKEETVRIIVQECCHDDLVDLQIALFDKFLYESYELILVVSSENATLRQSLRAKASRLNFTYSECPAKDLPSCYDFSYRTWVSSFSGLVMFANDDMFMWRPFSVRQYKNKWHFDVAAMVETHNGEYLHPGLHILDTTTLPKDVKNMVWGCCDVGGQTIEWMRNHPAVRLHPLMWSRNMQPDTLAALRLIPMELAALLNDNHKRFNIAADLYLENFAILHPRGSSNWQGYTAEQNNDRMAAVKNFLCDVLENSSSLTWSDRGASTEKAHISELMKHAAAWPANTIEPFDVSSDHSKSLFDGVRSGNVQLLASSLATTSGDVVTATPGSPSPSWLELLFAEADRIKALIENRKRAIQSEKLPLPPDDPPRTNVDLTPPRYDKDQYLASTVYYWKYIYNSSTPEGPPEFTTNCGKQPNQKYWVATYAAGEKRQRLARIGLTPSCLEYGADEVVTWTPEDLDAEYKRRNAQVLSDSRGEGNWAWKHYVQYQMLDRMGPDDILFYSDSDQNCTADLKDFFCLANKNDVTPFHHSHPDYTLERLCRRDAMVFMDMDRERVAHSVQYSGGSVFYKKTEKAVQYVRELAAWSMQPEVVRGWQMPSEYSVDWPQYLERGMMHQCDQAVSSLLIMKYGWKSYPWVMEGYGGGSDDVRNAAERAECGMPLNASIRTDWAQIGVF